MLRFPPATLKAALRPLYLGVDDRQAVWQAIIDRLRTTSGCPEAMAWSAVDTAIDLGGESALDSEAGARVAYTRAGVILRALLDRDHFNTEH